MSENTYWSHQNHVSRAFSRFDGLNLVRIFVRAWHVRTLGSKRYWRLVCNRSSVLSGDVWRRRRWRVGIFGDHGWRNGIGRVSRVEQLFLEKGIDDKEIRNLETQKDLSTHRTVQFATIEWPSKPCSPLVISVVGRDPLSCIETVCEQAWFVKLGTGSSRASISSAKIVWWRW